MTSLSSVKKTTIAKISLLISLIVLALKYAAWHVTGSVALLSDAMETIINVVAAIAGLWALDIASRPPDENHMYGHYKAEYLSAVVEGVLVILTSIAIASEAWHAWVSPRAPFTPWIGLLLNASGGVINLCWALIMIRVGRLQRSPAIIAGAHHIFADVWTTLALVLGVSLIPITGYARLDSIIAGLIAFNVLRVGYSMMRHSIAGLMDEAPDSTTQDEIRAIIANNAAGAIEAHDLRVRIVGAMAFIEFHLVVPGSMSVDHAHEICDQIEAALRLKVGNALIHVHVEPERKAKHFGAIVIA